MRVPRQNLSWLMIAICLGIIAMFIMAAGILVHNETQKWRFEESLLEYPDDIEVRAEFYCKNYQAWAVKLDCYEYVREALPECPLDGGAQQSCMENKMYFWSRGDT